MKFLRCLLAFAVLSLSLAPFAPAAVYSVTAASVAVSNPRYIKRGIAAASITAGQALAFDADENLILADADHATPTTRTLVGIALNAASTGQPINYTVDDPEFTPGFTVAAGAVVVLSTTAGGMAPVADLATGNYTFIVGVGIGGNKLRLGFLEAGVAVP